MSSNENFSHKTQNTRKYPLFTKKHKNYQIIVIINLTPTIYLCYNIFHIIFVSKGQKYVHKS